MSETETIHSSIGASSMYRWENCPGSVRLSKGVKSVASEWALEGTRAHEVAAAILTQDKFDPADLPDDMLDAVRVYTDLINNELFIPGHIHKIEHHFSLEVLHPGLFGTADAVGWIEEEDLLKVYDYKHGAGLLVDVEGNSQLLYYALGAAYNFPYKPENIELVIVQPRCDHPQGVVRRWRISFLQLAEFAIRLKEAALRTEDPNAPLVTGDHCRFCPAAGFCPERKKDALEVAKSQFMNLEVDQYDRDELGRILAKLDVLEEWAKSVRSFAYREAARGIKIPGHKLVAQRSNRRWAHDEAAVVPPLLKAGLGKNDLYTIKLKSVAQIEKLMGAKQFKKLENLVEKVSGGEVLVPESDSRPEVVKIAGSEFDFIDMKELRENL